MYIPSPLPHKHLKIIGAMDRKVMTTITRAELNPVILINLFMIRRLSVTTLTDSLKETATLSMTFICQKKTKL